ncbi:retrovirus-related pol polyprotein from transposon TNT 1-94 [Tanacetum coccineum]
MDLCGPMRIQSINGRKYILVIVDDYSRFTCVKFLRSNDEFLAFVIKFLKMIQVCLNATVRNIRTDNGTEFVNQTLRTYYEDVGISHQTPVARTPQQNVVVERQNRTLVEAARTMLIFSNALLFLWEEAVATACYTQNRSLIRKRHNKTPYELLHDWKPDLSFLYVFGALCYPNNDSEDHGTKPQILTPRTINSGLVPQPPSPTSNVPPKKDDWDVLFQPMFDEFFKPPPSFDHLVPPVAIEEPAVSTGTPSSTTINQDAPYISTLQTTQESQSQVISPSVEEEYHDIEVAHMDNDPYFGLSIPKPSFEESSSRIVDHPLENVIGDPSRPVSTRLQLHTEALFCYYDAFLSSIEPKRYKNALTKSCWIEARKEALNEFEILEVWELVPRPDRVMIITLKWIYKVKLDELGGVLKNKASPRGIFLNQSKYASEIIKKYGMKTVDPVNIPMVEKSKVDEDPQGKSVDPTSYRGMIGSLMYLTASRPDLVFAVCMCARYQAKPTEKHLHAVKRIFQYLRGTINMGLWYSKDSCIALTAYEDADHAGCQDTRKSTSGSLQLLGDRLVSWSSKKQNSTAISSTEAECIALSGCLENGVVELYFVGIVYQLENIFTKPLARERLKFLINKLGMRSMSPETLKQLADKEEE